MIEEMIVVKNRAGIHTRPAAAIAKLASKYKSDIYFIKDNTKVNAKSVMGIITLGSPYQDRILMQINGEDEQELKEAIVTLFENRFEETL